MIDYSPLWKTMKERNITQYYLVNNGIIDYRTMDRLRNNRNITVNTIEKLCHALNCTPNDILQFLPDETDTPLN